MRFHVVALPHTQTNRSHSACAFTCKIFHFAAMMKSLGHEVFHYGVEGSEVECDEDIQVLSKAEQEGFFGPYNPDSPYEVDWSGRAPYWQLLNTRAAAAINQRKQPGDFVCIIMGTLNLPLVEAVGNMMVVEYGAGYNGLLPRKTGRYRVYESYAHMHKIWGAEGGFDPDGYFYDVVVNNYLEPNDYQLQTTKGDYYLYLGRLIKRKGIHIAVETCKRIGAKLKIAGHGCIKVEGNRIYCEDGEVYEGVEYVGFATGKKRAQLYQNAIATFVPTQYIEPFGAVAIESQMAGTPAITTDWGAFPETVEHGKTGYRCRTLDHFVWAARNAPLLDPKYIHERAVANYSMDRVRWKYQEYFQMLTDLWGQGWYTERERTQLDWLN